MSQNSGLAHCMYCDSHWDYCCDYQGWVDYLLKNEAVSKQDLHLKLFKLIPDELAPGRESEEWDTLKKVGQSFAKAKDNCAKAKEAFDNALKTYVEAWENLNETREIYHRANEAYHKTKEVYDEALNAYYEAWDAYFSKYTEELQILHNKMFPDCPWDGESIF